MYFKKKRFANYQNIIILASLLPIIIFGILIYNNSKEVMLQNTFDYLQRENKQKKETLQKHFEKVAFTSKELAKTIRFLEQQARNNIQNIQELQKNHIQNYYDGIENTLISLAKKDVFQYIFSFLHRGKTVNKTYFDDIYSFKEELGLGNILMMDKAGKVLYSSDEKTLLHKNALALTRAYQKTYVQSKQHSSKHKIAYVTTSLKGDAGYSYKQYAIAYFKDVQGYIAMEIQPDKLQAIVENVSSLGKTAETYLVYKYGDATSLATNRKEKKGRIGDTKEGKYIQLGFEKSGTAVKHGSTGYVELLGYTPLRLNNMLLSMQTTVKYTDVISPLIQGLDYFEQYILDYDYKNIMLVDSSGEVFYSIKKEADYETNMLYGKYASSHLGKAIQKVFTTKKFLITDLDFYEPCPNDLDQFALYPILGKNAEIESVLVIQLNVSYLQDLMQKVDGGYTTLESYLVGEDKRLRSNSFLLEKYTAFSSFKENILIDTSVLQEVLQKGLFLGIADGYRDTSVLSSAVTLEFTDVKWAVISDIDEEEILALLYNLKITIFIFVLISSLVALLVMFFITNEKKKHDKKLEYTATHDALTLLPNRALALEFLTRMLANQKRFKKKGAVLFMDLDKFKVINDSYGHDAGDVVLIEVAKRLRTTLREEDLVARQGGDEFVVILNNFNTLVDVDKVCQKLIKTVSQSIADGTMSYKVGMSIGISVFPDDSTKPEELLQFSDTALFRTKENGRNGYTYYSKEMTESSLRASRVEESLKNAIKMNELELYYQPQVDLKTSRVMGVEALVRWNHPTDGLIMPNDFIPIAEESNVIIDLGYWVTYEACRNFKKWKEAGSDLEYIAVNMSTKQLQCFQCVANMQTIFDVLDFKAEWLELEITENTLIENLDNTLKNIDTFKEMGIKFSIDDFGTGYSSLSYLKSLKISTLKIDREFIKDITEDVDDRTIVEAIIVMGQTLGYKIVAEGAETKESIELLKTLHCDIVQGYYYSKPLPEKELMEYLNVK